MSADSDASAARRDRPDFDRRPLVAVWETTQACDLACLHCRAEAQAARNPGELDTQEARRLLDDVRDRGDGKAVMGGDRNHVHIVTSAGVEELPEMGKEDVARELVRRAAEALVQ